jgi:pimeloyl-ACP methyl ester carboxylesterase
MDDVATGERLNLSSVDGTPIAVWVEGEGPPLVMVHGSLQDHTASRALIDELRSSFTTFCMDRRGFGASGDSEGYDIQREFEDVAAVVDAAAARTGEGVTVWGHSFGASCAMGGAVLSRNVGRLVLYEPSLGLTYPPGSIDRVERALEEGDREAAIEMVFAEVLEMTAEEIEVMRSAPEWSRRVGVAHTVPRECRAEQDWVYRPGQFDGINAETLFLAGSLTPAAVWEATQDAMIAIPDARLHLMDGHGHLAHRADPEMVAGLIKAFVLT